MFIPMSSKHTGEKGDTIGPGQYNPEKLKTVKSTTWHASKTARELAPLKNLKESQDIGPGKYDILENSQSKIKYQQSPSKSKFIRKMEREEEDSNKMRNSGVNNLAPPKPILK